MSTSTAGQFTRSTNNACKRSMPHIDIQLLFNEVVAHCYGDVEAVSFYLPIGEKYRERYGDYAYYGVLDLWDKLGEYLDLSPIAIAQIIKNTFEYREFDMIKTLSLHDAGVLCFSLEGSWIAKRINMMFKNGIKTWAPMIYDVKTQGRVVFVFPTNYMGSDMVRATYMRDALQNLFLYSGADVGSGYCNDEAMQRTHDCFTEIHGKIVSNLHPTSLNGPNVEAVFNDLAILWYGVNIQKAHMMVYMTPHRLRGYIEHCHIAAADEGWLPCDWEELGTLTCCGFRTFNGKQQELAYLWDTFNHRRPTVLLRRIEQLGYNSLEFFECAFRFTCLRSHRLAECIFKYEDIVDEQGNTFASLLKTQSLVLSLIKDSPGGNFKLHALAGKERDLGLHIVKFTEIIEWVCRVFVPHCLCEYLCHLSELFKCCYICPGENMLGLCKATQVVMNKCFQLLGINPSLGRWTDEFKSLVAGSIWRQVTPDYRIPFDDARIEHPNSRVEIISMSVTLLNSQFEKGTVCGTVKVLDTCRLGDWLGDGRGWVSLDKNDDCHVAYYGRQWYDAETLLNGSYIPLGNTSSIHSIPVSSSLKVEMLIKATSEEKDETYLVCSSNHTVGLEEFWDGNLNAQCGTIESKSACGDRRVTLEYVVIKDAVDTITQVLFYPFKSVRLSGSITASYGDDFAECGFLGQYIAHIFRADPTTQYTTFDKPHLLLLHKSAMAVPANGRLKMKANLVDVDTNQCIVDKRDIFVSRSSDGVYKWKIECDIGVFELILRAVVHKE